MPLPYITTSYSLGAYAIMAQSGRHTVYFKIVTPPDAVMHTECAKSLAKALGWDGMWIVGDGFQKRVYTRTMVSSDAVDFVLSRDPEAFGREAVDYFIVRAGSKADDEA